jgi:protein SCO1
MRRILLLWILISAAHAGPLALPAVPHPEYVQKLGTRLPLSLAFFDEGGAPATLRQYFDERPVVLVLGYYQCPNLCSTMMEGVLESLSRTGMPRNSYRVVEVSIDPQETPELAARKKMSYEPMFGRNGVDLHLLTGDKSSIALLTDAAGFHYIYDPALRQYIHPAGFVVATGEGKISRYFLGVRFDPEDIRTALRQASGGNVGTPIERLLLLCSHYDPTSGRYSGLIMTLIRTACIAVLIALAGWMWRREIQRRRAK